MIKFNNLVKKVVAFNKMRSGSLIGIQRFANNREKLSWISTQKDVQNGTFDCAGEFCVDGGPICQ
jgi:hypothetical protein